MSAATDVARNNESQTSFSSIIEQRRRLVQAKPQPLPAGDDASPSDVVHGEMDSRLRASEAARGHASLQELLEENTARQQVQGQQTAPDLSENGAVARDLADVVRQQMMGLHISAATQTRHAADSRAAKKPIKDSHGREEGEVIESAGTAGANI